MFLHEDMSSSVYEVDDNLDLINLLNDVDPFEKIFKWSKAKKDWVEVKRREV